MTINDRRNPIHIRRKNPKNRRSNLTERRVEEVVCRNECKDRGSVCLKLHKDGLGCTRLEGHKGKHSACGFSIHDLTVWK